MTLEYFYKICVYHLWFVFFPWGIPRLQSDWSLPCDHGLDYASQYDNNNNLTNRQAESARA